MADEVASHMQYIEQWLQLLSYPPRGEIDFEVLRAGQSGAMTYRLRVSGEVLVLKIIPVKSAPYVLKRGERETLFYTLLAASIPVLTPKVVACYGPDARGCALLLKAYDSLQAIARWPETDYQTAARQLARLHAAYWDKTDTLQPYTWLRQPSHDFAPYREGALTAWRALWTQERLAALFDTRMIRRIEQEVDELTRSPSSNQVINLPLTLCHGDAHHENVLVRGDGAWVWADWQEVGIGYGHDDLSFFYQRAAAAGGRVSLSLLLHAYQAELANCVGTTIDLTVLEQAVARSELTTRLLHWPAYLADAADAVVRQHVARVAVLLDSLETV
jgi:aminoglycoside phosphotransferase